MTTEMLQSILSDETTCDILRTIGDNGNISFKKIRNTFQNANGENLDKRLEKLKRAHLIGVVGARYRDFDAYYLTTEGLKTVRLLAHTFAMGK